MPFAALVDSPAPPPRAVADKAAANDPTVRTAEGASSLKSAGSAEGVVADAGMPMPSKFCVEAVAVVTPTAPRTAEIPKTATISGSKTAHTTSARTRLDFMKEGLSDG